MLIAFMSMLTLLPPFVYASLIVIAWACVSEQRMRYLLLAALSIPPIILGFNAIRELQTVNAAEEQFSSLCANLEKPKINATARDITSVFVDMRPPDGVSKEAEKHAALALPSNELGRVLLQGSSQYTKIEYQIDPGVIHTIQANPRARPINPGTASSTHKVMWKSISEPSKYVTNGILVIKESATNEVLAEFSLIQLHSPIVALFGEGQRSLRLADKKNRSCPGIRGTSQFIKSVIRPTLKGVN
jgi:hypothetical protein